MRAERSAASAIRRARTGRVRAATRGPSAAHSLDELVQGLQLLLQRAADLLAEGEDALVDDPIVDVGSLLAAAEHAALGKDSEMLGDVLLGGAERRAQLVHARLALAQAVEEADPHRLAD